MQLLKVKDLYLPHCYPFEIKKNRQLEYFIYGQGWKKTKTYKIVEGVELPEKWAELHPLDIAILFDKYGIEVANIYAERKTAGIDSRQYAKSYGYIYRNIKDILPEDFDRDFFTCLKVMWEPACFGLFVFDICETDNAFGEIDKKYRPMEISYINQKGEDMKSVSMHQYVEMKYGEPYVKIIEALIKTADLSQQIIQQP